MDQSTNNFVTKLLPKDKAAWTGGVKHSNGWYWHHLGAKISWFNWSPGQPSNTGGNENFLQIWNGQWNDAPDMKLAFVCEYINA